MSTTDSVFQRALSNMLTELFDGPPGQEAYLLNPGDSGLLRQLDMIEASAASKRPMPGKTTIAAHVDHLHFGLAILNRWASAEANPTRGSPSGSRQMAKNRRDAHELGRHGRCGRPLHRRPHGVPLWGNQA